MIVLWPCYRTTSQKRMKADAMADLDVALVLWLNQYSQRYPVVDTLMATVFAYQLFRGAVIVALLWWAWMGSRTRLVTDDLFLVRTVLGIIVALAVARGLQNFLWHRPRPLHDQALDFRVPLGGTEDALKDWSSFPSDHAVLVAALVVAVLLLNRSLGILAAIWAACVVLLPRVYLGLHYPSDIVGGAIVGMVIMLAAQWLPLPRRLGPILMDLEDQHRGLAYAAFFVFSFFCATMFDDVRQLLRLVARIVL